MSLLPVLGLLFGIAVSIGSTLGVGILRQPSPVASYHREPWLSMLLRFAGAVYAALGASNVSELATMLPREAFIFTLAPPWANTRRIRGRLVPFSGERGPCRLRDDGRNRVSPTVGPAIRPIAVARAEVRQDPGT
jgi:hypothetical protein